MQYLRTNTAVIVSVGPFLDKTDGVTLETSLTITNERITLVAETDDGSAPTNILDNVTGATSGTSNDLNYITGNDAGMMQLELSAANVNRLGRMRLIITDAANHCPVFHEYTVIPADLYDTMFAANSNRAGVIVSGTIGSTGNSTTALHLTGLTYGNDEINDLMIVVKDVSTNERHARWIDDWADTGDLATVATLPFTPQNAVDTYEILAIRRDAIPLTGTSLTAIPWNASWDAEVQSEVADALAVYDPPTNTEMEARTIAAASYATAANLALLQTYPKNVAVAKFGFAMYLTDGTLATGVSVAGVISKDGGNFASITDSPAEIQTSGCYEVDLAQAEMNADEILLKFTGTGCRPLVVKIRTQA